MIHLALFLSGISGGFLSHPGIGRLEILCELLKLQLEVIVFEFKPSGSAHLR